MGKVDTVRQALNVARMRLLGGHGRRSRERFAPP
jgi:tryptophan synthase beta subunit